MPEAYISAWYFISSQSPFQSSSSSLPPEREMTPPFSHSPSTAAKRQVHKTSWNLKFLPTSFPLSALSVSVWPPLSYTHTWLSLNFCELVMGCEYEKNMENGRKQSKKESEMWLGALITAVTPSVLVSEISHLGGTQWKVHSRRMHSFLKLPFTDSNQLRSWFMAKLNKQRGSI